MDRLTGDLVLLRTTGAVEDDEAAEETAAVTGDIHCVTAADVSEQRFSITDVVLPLPGFDVQYPTNPSCSVDVYQAKMAELGLDMSDPEVFQQTKHKTLRLRGGYRRVVQSARDVSFDFVSYSDPNVRFACHQMRCFLTSPICQTDLRETELDLRREHIRQKFGHERANKSADDTGSGTLALLLSFSLGVYLMTPI